MSDKKRPPQHQSTLSARDIYEIGTDPEVVLQALKSEGSEGAKDVWGVKGKEILTKKQHGGVGVLVSGGGASLERRHNEAVLTHLKSFSETEQTNDVDFMMRLRNMLNALRSTGSDGAKDSELGPELKAQQTTAWEGAADCDAEEIGALAIWRLLVLRHNLGLALLSAGRGEEALSVLTPLSRRFRHAPATTPDPKMHRDQDHEKMGGDTSDTDNFFHDVRASTGGNLDEERLLCRVGFLVLDCLLSSGRNAPGLTLKQDFTEDIGDPMSAHDVLQWIDRYVDNLERLHSSELQPLPEGRTEQQHQATNEHNRNTISPLSLDAETVTELRFRLHLYRTRFLLTFQPTFLFASLAAGDDSSDRDASMRLARKELKSTMEIYQRKLAVPNANPSLPNLTAASITERSKLLSAETEVNTHAHHTKLHGQNQSALNLKAKWEYLKGNVKKSLKLCAESRMVAERRRSEGTRDDIDEAINYNNLAILHQTAGKVNLALHYYGRAIRHAENEEHENTRKSASLRATFTWDGIARTLPIADLLSNASVCALQARKYVLSYSWMLQCLSRSHHLHGKNPRCWLRMAECCIGVHKEQKAKSQNRPVSYTATKRDGMLFASFNTEEMDSASSFSEISSASISRRNIEELHADPLKKAALFLQRAYALAVAAASLRPMDKSQVRCYEQDNENVALMESALLSMAYISLEQSRHAAALHLASSVQLGTLPNSPNPKVSAETGVSRHATGIASVASRKRRSVIASIYVAEARRRLGLEVSMPKSTANTNDISDGPGSKQIAEDMNMARWDAEGKNVPANSSSLEVWHQSRLCREATVLDASLSAMHVSHGSEVGATELARSVVDKFSQGSAGVTFDREISSVKREVEVGCQDDSLRSLHWTASVAENSLVYAALTQGQTGVALSLLKKKSVRDPMLS